MLTRILVLVVVLLSAPVSQADSMPSRLGCYLTTQEARPALIWVKISRYSADEDVYFAEIYENWREQSMELAASSDNVLLLGGTKANGVEFVQLGESLEKKTTGMTLKFSDIRNAVLTFESLPSGRSGHDYSVWCQEE